MVVFHIKNGQADGFLYEASVQNTNDELIEGLVGIWNMRIRLTMLIGAVRELAKYGPMKPQEEHGIDSIKEEHEGATIEKSANYVADPSGTRTGNGPGPQLAETLERVCVDTEDALSAELVKRRLAVSMAALEDKLANLKGAVMMAYPMGLPAWDPVALCINGEEGLDGTQAAAELLEPGDVQLWVASKDFPRGQKVGDRLGWNEKTKVVAKLQRSGSGPPAREPAVSEEERKAMMAHYFKRQVLSEYLLSLESGCGSRVLRNGVVFCLRSMLETLYTLVGGKPFGRGVPYTVFIPKQEEMKKLAEAEDDDYLSSQWADPKAMQKSLRGVGPVKAPGLRL